MPKACSLDLRELVARFVGSGRSRHAAAAYFKVFVNLMKAYRMTGSLEPKPGGGRRHAKLDPHRAFLLARVAERDDITMPELAAELAFPPWAQGLTPPRSRAGSSATATASKKTLLASEQDRPDVRQAREEWTATREPRMRLEAHRLGFFCGSG